MSEQQAPVFTIEKVYAKDISLEIPNAPQVFLSQDNPAIEMQLQTEAANIEDGLYEVTVTVTITAKHADKTVFLVEVGQAGIFQLRNLPTDNIEPILGVACPTSCFPTCAKPSPISSRVRAFRPCCSRRSTSKRCTPNVFKRSSRLSKGRLPVKSRFNKHKS